jgi:hypothetical protein
MTLLDPHQPIVSATEDAPARFARRIARSGRIGGLADGHESMAKKRLRVGLFVDFDGL